MVERDGNHFPSFAVYISNCYLSIFPVVELILIGHQVVTAFAVQLSIFSFINFSIQFDKFVFRPVQFIFDKLLEPVFVRQNIAAI